jgi:hypothetical protein
MKTEKEIVAQMLRRRQVTPDRIGFGIAKVDAIKTPNEIGDKIKPGDFGDDFAYTTIHWPGPLKSGGCVCSDARITIDTDGYAEFQAQLITENPGHDSWGILRFDFYNSTGGRLGSYPDFWSPTIHSGGGDGQYWEFTFRYALDSSLFSQVAWVSMTYHC